MTRQIDIIETETDVANINTPLQAPVQSMSIIEALELVLTNFTLSDSSPLQSLDNIIAANADCNAKIDHIYADLSFNTL